jgi:serine/threonine protein kinase
MEICQNLSPGNFDENQLYENMTIMHALHLMHSDIKPENIMYSPHYKKLVFVDFGLSTIVSEELGGQSRTKFRGSVNFCCLDMAKLFSKRKNGFVDLYYNDLYAL